MRNTNEPRRRWGIPGCLVLLAALPACSRSGLEDMEARNGAPAAHAHAGSGETCFLCDPAKRDPGRLWCAEHARYEDRCWLCHPELEQEGRPYCAEHSLYEDECFLCHPELREDSGSTHDLEPTPGGPDALFCAEHRLAERECGICQPQLARDLRPGESLKIRFKSKLSASKAGIRTTTPRVTESRAAFDAFCEVQYDTNRMAHITPLAPGIVRRVLADVGAKVTAGQALVRIHSAEVAAAKTAFLSAVVDHRLKEAACRREERLVRKKISAEREYQEAEAACKAAELALKTARQQLLNYGLTESGIRGIRETQDGSALLTVKAPYEGTIVRRNAVVGEAVEPGQPLLTLADLSEMWLELSIPADRLVVVDEGLRVDATFTSLPGFTARGTITWVDSAMDERTRMVKARAVVPNAERKLKRGMFGTARVILSSGTDALRIPKSAVQRLESHPYVFVRIEDDLYSLRRIVPGNATERSVDVIQGLEAGEAVVVEGTFTVMSEFLKSRLGAGCVDE